MNIIKNNYPVEEVLANNYFDLLLSLNIHYIILGVYSISLIIECHFSRFTVQKCLLPDKIEQVSAGFPQGPGIIAVLGRFCYLLGLVHVAQG